ncbi:MAG: alanyl-tRNA editing protein [Bryobacteraceae bacterium]
MTDRLYYTDSYLREFDARVVDRSADGRRVYLDRTAFYPASGGQPFDQGVMGDVEVVEVIDEGNSIAHVMSAPLTAEACHCRLDWARRFDHMQQHSGQHLLSAVFVELFGFQTVSFHLGQEASTIDLETAGVSAGQVSAVETRANEVVFENRPVAVSFADNSSDLDLRKEPEREGTLRIIAIEGIDRSACGGTHVRATGEIGPIVLRKLERIRSTVRVEFLCGMRTVHRARRDFEGLSLVAQLFSSALEDAPELVRAQMESLRAADKLRKKLESDLAVFQGRALYESTAPGADGLRRVVERSVEGSLESIRALAQVFCNGSRAVFLGVVENPPSLLLASSADSSIDSGKLLKTAVTAHGGRGGGAPRLAQGSVPSRDALEAAIREILS